ncbi:MFS transporter [Sodalis-like secondary symbiont of Drepanosiphum platanoidis]|uniref:MFS transporter n=1 Tax=Sodalis-like secondary symbiont of Drepanosiphum platanoidis TaxID=2994493 RepID=UPI003463C3C1
MEIRASIGLSFVIFLRMVGIFITMPILSIYGMTLYGNNKYLIGISIGIYGLIQSIFQIPMGFLSDFIKRKLIINIGLLLLIIGSIINAITNNIWGFIIGRALQGSGAITSVIMALLSDLVSKKNQTKSMSFIGISFALSFIIAFILNPIIINIFGIKSIFWFVSFLSFVAIIIVIYIVPNPLNKINKFNEFKIKNLYKIFINKKLLKINYNIFSLHAILSSNFISIPIIMNKYFLYKINQWKIYLFILIISFIINFLFTIYFKFKKNFNKIFLLIIIFLFFSEIILFFNKNKIELLLGLQFFFISFTILEVLLSSMIIRKSNKKYKGISMSLYSSSQFLGLAIGGISSSYFFNIKNINLVFIVGVIISFILIIINIKNIYKN